jgi:dihydrofolate synthase/folylpolyglutamate synthase
MMTPEAAVAYIEGLLTRARTAAPGDERIKLRRAEELLARIGSPHRVIPTVLIAGTKGKGSTAAMMASILQNAGFRVGLYTKPHLVDYRERVRVDGILITPAELVETVETLVPHIEAMAPLPDGPPSYFEASVAVAFRHFARHNVDIALVEVGLGGRLDATNVADPIISVITPVSYDHMHVLGTTLEAIAREKAGIIRQDGLVISAPQAPEALAAIIDICVRDGAELRLVHELMHWKPVGGSLHEQTFTLRSPLQDYGRLRMPLIGAHQMVNAATGVAALEGLGERGFRVTREDVAAGLASLSWPARVEVVGEHPYVVVDVAHNPASLAALRETLEALFPGRRIILVFGMVATHDHHASTSLIAPLADTVIVTTPHHLKPLPAAVLAEQVRRFTPRVEVIEDREAAAEAALALAAPDDVVVVTGSFFLVGDVREMLHRRALSATRTHL